MFSTVLSCSLLSSPGLYWSLLSSPGLTWVLVLCLCVQALSCSVVVQMVSNVKALLSETELLLTGKMSMVLVWFLWTFDS